MGPAGTSPVVPITDSVMRDSRCLCTWGYHVHAPPEQRYYLKYFNRNCEIHGGEVLKQQEASRKK